MTVVTKFTVRGDTHYELVTAATAVWREISGKPDADLPEGAFLDVYSADETFGVAEREPAYRSWQADVVVVTEPGHPGWY